MKTALLALILAASSQAQTLKPVSMPQPAADKRPAAHLVAVSLPTPPRQPAAAQVRPALLPHAAPAVTVAKR